MTSDYWGLPQLERDRLDFARDALDSRSWFIVAESLLAAAGALEPLVERFWKSFQTDAETFLASGQETAEIIIELPVDVRAIHLMLMAYAAENLCKGFLVAVNPRMVGKDRLSSNLTQHNLLKLLKTIGFAITQEEQMLAWRLERCAVWSGRYPVPKSPDKIRAGPGGASNVPWAFFSSQDVNDVGRFIERLREFCYDALNKSADRRTTFASTGRPATPSAR